MMQIKECPILQGLELYCPNWSKRAWFNPKNRKKWWSKDLFSQKRTITKPQKGPIETGWSETTNPKKQPFSIQSL